MECEIKSIEYSRQDNSIQCFVTTIDNVVFFGEKEALPGQSIRYLKSKALENAEKNMFAVYDYIKKHCAYTQEGVSLTTAISIGERIRRKNWKDNLYLQLFANGSICLLRTDFHTAEKFHPSQEDILAEDWIVIE